MPVLEYGTTKWIYRNITPLTLDISAQNPKRVNLLLATINFDYVFAGYIGMFNMALRLAPRRLSHPHHPAREHRMGPGGLAHQYPEISRAYEPVR